MNPICSYCGTPMIVERRHDGTEFSRRCPKEGCYVPYPDGGGSGMVFPWGRDGRKISWVPVFDALVRSAAELNDEEVAAEYREEGEELTAVASRVRGILSAVVAEHQEKDRAMTTPVNPKIVDILVEVTHEANRTYCQMLGDTSQVPWKEAPQWQRESAVLGVRSVLNGTCSTPEEQHAAWMRHKEAEGWVWGPTKDVEAKTHPCMLRYDQLPIEQRVKDVIFRSVVIAAMAVMERVLQCDQCGPRTECGLCGVTLSGQPLLCGQCWQAICVACAGSDPEICSECEEPETTP